MNAEQIIESLHRRGATLAVREGKLSIKAPPGALTPELLELTKQHKPDVIAYINRLTSTQEEMRFPPMPELPEQEHYAASLEQRSVWTVEQVNGPSAIFNLPWVQELTGVLDLPALRFALNAILSRHEILRTVYFEQAGELRQTVRDLRECPLRIDDLTARPGELERLVQEETQAPFDLTRNPAIRARVLKLSGTRHILLVTLHHIAADGWSIGLLAGEFAELYRAHCENCAPALQAVEHQYKDYTHWQRELCESVALERALEQVCNGLRGMAPLHQFPLDYPRPRYSNRRGAWHVRRLPIDAAERLRVFCQKERLTAFTVLQTLYALLISKYSHDVSEVIVGSPMANRVLKEHERIMGLFANTMLLRNEIHPDISVRSLLAKNHREFVRTLDRQFVPFDRQVARLVKQTSFSYTPGYQLMFVLQNNKDERIELPGLVMRDFPHEHRVSRCDMVFEVTELPDGLQLRIEYDTELFAEATIAAFCRNYCAMLARVLEQPEVLVRNLRWPELAVISSQSGTRTQSSLSERVAHFVRQQPDRVAFQNGEVKWTYSLLDQRAGQLARALQLRGIDAGQTVALTIDSVSGQLLARLALERLGCDCVTADASSPACCDRVLDASMLEGIEGLEPLSATQASTRYVQAIAFPGIEPQDHCLLCETHLPILLVDSLLRQGVTVTVSDSAQAPGATVLITGAYTAKRLLAAGNNTWRLVIAQGTPAATHILAKGISAEYPPIIGLQYAAGYPLPVGWKRLAADSSAPVFGRLFENAAVVAQSEHAAPVGGIGRLQIGDGAPTAEHVRLDHSSQLRSVRPAIVDGQYFDELDVLDIVLVHDPKAIAHVEPLPEGALALFIETQTNITDQLAQQLPDYLGHITVCLLPRLPADPLGVVSRDALPKISHSRQSEMPGSFLEQQLHDIWTRFLGVERVSVETHFFEAGGYSLLATQIIHQIQEQMCADFKVKDFLTSGTIRRQARLIEERLMANPAELLRCVELVSNMSEQELQVLLERGAGALES